VHFHSEASVAPARWLHFIALGKPVQNAHIESFHGGFRDECLSWFPDVPDARRIIAAWGQDANTGRPHSALGYMTPEEFEQFTLTRAEPVGLAAGSKR